MHSNDVETAIIDKLSKRDPEGLAAAYTRYATVAYSLILRITRDTTAAEDLLQELFMRLWNRSRDFDSSRGSLSVWLLAIARNIAIDHVRSSHSRFSSRLRSIDTTDSLQISYKPSEPESVLDRTKVVREALDGLNPNQRRVLEMAYFEGFTQSEIAARLKEPLGTVKSWMRAAMGRLRIAVKEGAAPK